MAHADFSSIRPLDLIAKSHAPIMIIQGADDPLATPQDQQQLERAIAQRNDRSIYWRVENIPHLMSSPPTPLLIVSASVISCQQCDLESISFPLATLPNCSADFDPLLGGADILSAMHRCIHRCISPVTTHSD